VPDYSDPTTIPVPIQDLENTRTKIMNEADLFSRVHGDTAEYDENDSIVKAITSYLKNHRINPDNAFETIRILFPTATFKIADQENRDEVIAFVSEMFDNKEAHVDFFEGCVEYYIVTFPDSSVGWLASRNGIGVFYTGENM
jgi:hypothetical protein